jgi:HlyD family secretion protein
VATASTDVTNYEVRIRLIPESYADLIDPRRPKNFPFRPGMSANADIQTNTHANVLSVPINAVTTREKSDTMLVSEAKDKKSKKPEEKSPETGEPIPSSDEEMVEVVFVLQPDGSVRRVKVRTDIQDIGYIEVVDGLKEGDQVVAGPYTVISKELRNGTKVKVVPKEELFEVKK